MSEIDALEWGEPLVEPKNFPELEAEAARKLGHVPDAIRYLGAAPWIAHTAIRISWENRAFAHLDFDLADLVFLVVSQESSCRYCFAAARTILRIHGYSRAEIEKLEEDLFQAELSPASRAALDLSRRTVRANPMPSVEDLSSLASYGFSEDVVRELFFATAVNVFFNRLGTLLAMSLEPVEKMAQDWKLKVFRRIVSRQIKKLRRRGVPTPLPEGEARGPFAPFVLAFGDLPAARILRDSLDDAFASGILPRRTKAWVFAVVARAIGARVAEREARDVLVGEGVPAEAIDSGLAHLAGEALDSLEARALPYARDTVRPDPPRVQRQGRPIRESLSVERFTELAGTAALANLVCRLEPLVERG